MNIDVFVSYHTQSSQNIVEAIVNNLEGRGIRCWYSGRDNIAGPYTSGIMGALRQCKVFLLVLNQSASESTHVLNELEIITERLAKKESVVLLPFHVADDEISEDAWYYIKRHHWIDAMTPPVEDRIQELAENLEKIIGAMGTQASNDTTKSTRQDTQKRSYRKVKQETQPFRWEDVFQDLDKSEAERFEAYRPESDFLNDTAFWFDSTEYGFDADDFFSYGQSYDEDDRFEKNHAKAKQRGNSNRLVADCFSAERLQQLSEVKGKDVRCFEVRKIRFMNCLDYAPKEALDVSELQDGSVVMWANGCDQINRLDLVVAADGIIHAGHACEELFRGLHDLEEIIFGGCFSTKGATSMARMFNGCRRLYELDLSGFDTSQVTAMQGMFESCSNLERLDLSGFDTSKTENMAFMFSGCRSLCKLDISSFDTSKVRIMNDIFSGCYELEELDIRHFDLSSVVQIHSPFGYSSEMKVLYNEDMVRNLSRFNREWFYKSLGMEDPWKKEDDFDSWFEDFEEDSEETSTETKNEESSSKTPQYASYEELMRLFET